MKIISSLNFLKIIAVLILGSEIFGFFYFENSIILLMLVILLGLVGLWQLRRNPEILAMLMLYLGLDDFYNVRYGLAVPMATILIAVFFLALFLTYLLMRIYKYEEILEKSTSSTYLLTSGLVVLEIFLAMSLWPVDPKTKSLVIVIVFYLMNKLIYLNINRVLNLKRASGFIIVSIIILASVISLGW